METKFVINKLNNLKRNIKYFQEYTWGREQYKKEIKEDIKDIIAIERLKDTKVVDELITIYELIYSNKSIDYILEELSDSKVDNMIEGLIEELSKECYGKLMIGYEDYKIKTIMYYSTEEDSASNIAYMAGSFYTDQEYRTFLANIQKGRRGLRFRKVTDEYMYDLCTTKNGYLSRVKKAFNSNTQDGYHADFHLDNDRFILLRRNDNPVDIVYKWIVKNTKSAVLEEWKEYLYNSLIEGGNIIECDVINYTNHELRGIVLSDEVNTDLIREIRKEGLELSIISIPRKPVDLDPSMSFVDAMTKFIIPEITQGETLYTVGDEISEHINSPIVFKRNNSLIKSHLFPKQKVMAQGMLNGIKKGRTSIILNGGMGVGKTYISIKLAYATIKEHFKRDHGRIAVYCQGHLIPKWERQFKEALPNVPLKFIKIEGYKDAINIPKGKPDGIEVYLLPKDKVKRKYLEDFSAKKRKYQLSNKAYEFYENSKRNEASNIFIANDVKLSEMKALARKIEKYHGRWICLAKEIFDEEGKIIGYKVVTTSNFLKEELGKTYEAYDFFIQNLDSINEYSEEIKEEYSKKFLINKRHQTGITCPSCGGFLYNNAEEQFSEDEWMNNLHIAPKTKSDRNKNCSNYIKIDGTPLSSYERKLIIKDKLNYTVIDEHDIEYTTPYLDSNNTPIEDVETIQKIKSGHYDERYTIALKKCNTPLWTAIDKKGYRTVNSIDIIERNFGKKFFDCNISDESHLYSAESSQGETFAKLCRLSKVNLALTGTLTGGKASHMFYTLYRMIPHKMSKYYKYSEVSKFIDHYGRRKKITKEYGVDNKYNKSGQGKISSTGWSEIPGISPLLYSHFLSDIMVSRKIEDMNMDLPELSYYKHRIEMTPELKKGYEKLKSDILDFIGENKHLNLGGVYLNALLSYPDMPITKPLMFQDMLISNPLPIDIENIILPKEQKLLDTVKREIKQGRRVVVYVSYTGTKAIDRRVEKVLKDAGVKVAVLKSSINTEKREKWIDDRYKEGVEVIITNPKLVQTGLDIIQYPTMYFYELDYDVRVVRQAESRAWRVGQKHDCRVYYSYYDDTIQFDALKLIGSKKKASLALEGVFAEDILSDMGDIGDSGMTALYKSLIGQIKLKEDDLDFFSSEEEIANIPPKEDCKTITTENTEGTDETGQLSLFTITETTLKGTSRKSRKNLMIGQVSMFEI